MLTWLRNLLRQPANPTDSGVVGSLLAETVNEDDPLSDVPRYPPFDLGIPVKPVERVVHGQRDLIAHIFRTAGLPREEFAQHIEPAIANLARYVHLLPASSTASHTGAGGLFRMSLEIGLYAWQHGNSAVFPLGGSVERRFHMQPRWAMASFLAGLCSQLYRPINNMAVFDKNDVQWKPLLRTLHDWATDAKADAYFIRWLDERNINGARASAAYVINVIIPSATLHYLTEDNNQIIQAMTAAIAGTSESASDNPILKIIAPVTTRVIEDDLKQTATHYGNHTVGIHLEPHIIDTMRRLIRMGTWSINREDDSTVWAGADGTYINWPVAAPAIVTLLTRDSFVGIPKDPETIAELLLKEGVIEARPGGGHYWTIMTPGAGTLLDSMVKLTRRSMIFMRGTDMAVYDGITLLMKPSKPDANPSTKKSAGATEQAGRNAPPATNSPAKAGSATSQTKNNPQRQGQKGQDVRHRVAANKELSAMIDGVPDLDGDASPPAYLDIPMEEYGDVADHGQTAEMASVTMVETEDPSTPVDDRPNRMLSQLTAESAEILRTLKKGHDDGTIRGVVANLPNGIGIATDYLTGHVKKPMHELLAELMGKRWLWIDKAKPSRMVHSVDINGAKRQVAILKPVIATELGLVA